MVITTIFVLLAIIIILLLVKFIKSKNYIAIIVILAIIVVTGLIYFVYTASRNYKIINSGYVSGFNDMIISSIDDYNKFMADSNDFGNEYKQKISSWKYNEKYFKNKSLALAFISVGNGSNPFLGVDISTNGNTLNIKVNTDHKDIPSPYDSISGKLILVEIDKNITQINVID